MRPYLTKLLNPHLLLISTLMLSFLGMSSQFSFAELKVLPSSPDKLVGFASSDEPCGWMVIGPNNTDIEPTISEDYKSVVFEGSAGSYIIMSLTNKTLPDGKHIPLASRKVVVLGGATPLPPPPPPVPPVPPGQKWLILVSERGKQSTPLAQLSLSLRADPELNRKLVLTDKDVPPGIVRSVVDQVPATASIPALLVVSSPDNKLLLVVTPIDTLTPAKVKEYLK